MAIVPKKSTAVKWLHISDLHFQSAKPWTQDVVLKSLLADIRKHYSGDESPDIVCVTGDIAHSGSEDEYELAENFFVELLRSVRLTPDRLFLVPGNHDIARNKSEDAFWGLRSRLTSQSEVDQFFYTADRRETIFRRQSTFRAFANKCAPPSRVYSPDSFGHVKKLKLGPLHVAGLLLDSAWLAEGGEGDRGRLLVGAAQIHSMDKDLEGRKHLTFALVHHPFDWLTSFECSAIESQLLKRCQLVFRGHVHSDDVVTTEKQFDRVCVFTAGAAFESRTSQNSYQLISLDLATGKGSRVVHRYDFQGESWPRSPVEPWKMGELDNNAIELGAAMDLLRNAKPEFRDYIGCLVAGHVGEVPVKIQQEICWVSWGRGIPETTDSFSPGIRRLRSLFVWKEVWDPLIWEAECKAAIESLERAIGEINEHSARAKAVLMERLETSKVLTQQLLSTSASQSHTAGMADHIRNVIAQGMPEKAIQLLEQARRSVHLAEDEEEVFQVLALEAYLKQGDKEKALACASGLVGVKIQHVETYKSIAVCFYHLGEYSKAQDAIETALERGIGKPIKEIAILVAGLTGDPELGKKAMAL